MDPPLDRSKWAVSGKPTALLNKALPDLPPPQKPTPPLPLAQRPLMANRDRANRDLSHRPMAGPFEAQINALERKTKGLQQLIASNNRDCAEKDRTIASLREKNALQCHVIEQQNTMVAYIAKTINKAFSDYENRLRDGRRDYSPAEIDTISEIIQVYSQLGHN